MISRFFIERPVLANVLAIVMVLIGAVALLLDRQRDGVDDGPGAGAGIAGGHLHGRRDHVGAAVPRPADPSQR
jgi:drug/metabolite transporter (DMT)-like permease